MPLDDFNDFSTPRPSGLAVLQKIALGLEIVLLVFAAIGLFFKIMSFPYADELLVLSYTSLPMIYLVLPILLFKSKKGAATSTGSSGWDISVCGHYQCAV